MAAENTAWQTTSANRLKPWFPDNHQCVWQIKRKSFQRKQVIYGEKVLAGAWMFLMISVFIEKG